MAQKIRTNSCNTSQINDKYVLITFFHIYVMTSKHKLVLCEKLNVLTQHRLLGVDVSIQTLVVLQLFRDTDIANTNIYNG